MALADQLLGVCLLRLGRCHDNQLICDKIISGKFAHSIQMFRPRTHGDTDTETQSHYAFCFLYRIAHTLKFTQIHIQININNQVENKTPAQSTSSHMGNTLRGKTAVTKRERKEKERQIERKRDRVCVLVSIPSWSAYRHVAHITFEPEMRNLPPRHYLKYVI